MQESADRLGSLCSQLRGLWQDCRFRWAVAQPDKQATYLHEAEALTNRVGKAAAVGVLLNGLGRHVRKDTQIPQPLRQQPHSLGMDRAQHGAWPTV